MIEVEIRAKLSENIQTQLEAFPNIQKDGEKKYQTDLYIKHTKDVNRDLVIRFRKTPNNVLLTFKGKSPTANDTARPEYETEIKNYEILLQILLSSGYEKLVTIDKVRERYTYNDMEINIDNIK
jgi:predicted adenylyl cyclase CyaB